MREKNPSKFLSFYMVSIRSTIKKNGQSDRLNQETMEKPYKLKIVFLFFFMGAGRLDNKIQKAKEKKTVGEKKKIQKKKNQKLTLLPVRIELTTSGL